MNKQELISDLESRDFVKKVFGLRLKTEKETGANWYEVPFLDAGAKVAVFRTLDIYVLDEGLSTEEAFYKDNEPKSSIKETNALVEQYKDQIASIKGKVLEANENYITVEAYKTTGEAGNQTTKKVTYIADADEIKVITE